MGRFVRGADRSQMTLLPECLDDWVGEDNPVHVIEAFVDALYLPALGFSRCCLPHCSKRSGANLSLIEPTINAARYPSFGHPGVRA